MSALKTFEKLPGWAKGVIAVTGVAVVLFVAYTGYKWLKNIFLNKDQKQTVNEADNQLNDLANRGIHPNYSDFQYKSYADTLDAAFQGYGTSVSVVYAVFNAMNNDADVVKLILAFDVRKIKSGTWNPAPDITGNLVTVMSDELSSYELAHVNGILENNNCSYRF